MKRERRTSPRRHVIVSVLMFTYATDCTANDDWLAIPEDDFFAADVPTTRASRFPSIEERVKLYMSNWYVPPCEGYDEGFVQYSYEHAPSNDVDWPTLSVQESADWPNRTSHVFESAVEPDKAFFMDRDTIFDCTIDGEGHSKFEKRIQFRSNMRMYCADVAGHLMTALEHTAESDAQNVPVLLQFGDLKHSHVYRELSLPHIKKFRSGASKADVEEVISRECYREPRLALTTVHETPYMQPVVWKLASSRHYKFLSHVYREDTAWEDKHNMAIFRGQLTGSRDGYDPDKSDEENCMNIRRCRLVYTHANSTLVHGRLTNTRKKVPDKLNGVNLVASSVPVAKLLEFKGIIMLEGNDVASGLKWALLSQSVVLMPAPKHTSWAMEELLEPWVHYVPLNEMATDVEEKMQWVVDHDDFARQITERATLWMEDLVYHPDSMEDDRLIQEDIVRRYRRHFVSKD